MPTYDYHCAACGWHGEQVVPIASRNYVACPNCEALLTKKLAAPLFRFKGVVTPGGGPDKFTADMLGIPLHDLPAGLKS